MAAEDPLAELGRRLTGHLRVTDVHEVLVEGDPQRRRDDAGRERVAGDVVLGEPAGRGLGERVHRELARAVRREARVALAPGDRRRVDDLAATGRDHPLGALLDADQGAEGIDVHDRVPVLLGDVEQVQRLVEAGVVEQDVEPPRALEERVERGDDLVALAHVGRQGDRGTRLRDDLGHDRVGRGRVEVEDSDERALTREPEGEGTAHAAARAGDDDALAGHTSRHVRTSW